MKLRRIARVGAGIILLGTSGLAGTFAVLALRHPNRLTLPAPSGPYAVGRIAVDWRDENRVDPLAPEPDTKRELPVWIWFPAEPGAEAPSAPYMPRPLRDAMQPDPPALLRFVMERMTTDRANVTSHALDGPALASAQDPFPVLLMKPALGAAAVQNSALAEDLASHGYVVVGSDSPHTTPAVVSQDGRVRRRSSAGHPSETATGPTSDLAPGHPNDFYLPVLDVWVEDERFLLDRLHELNESDPTARFAGRLDLDAIGSFGHSFGGATALQFCSVDPRCKAGVDIDGMMLGDVVRGGLSKPFLFLFADRPALFDGAESDLGADERAMLDALTRIRRELPNDRSLLLMRGAAHFNFFDQALLTEPHIWQLAGALGDIDRRRGLDVTRRYVRAFFDTHLKGAPDGLLDAPSSDYPEVRFK